MIGIQNNLTAILRKSDKFVQWIYLLVLTQLFVHSSTSVSSFVDNRLVDSSFVDNQFVNSSNEIKKSSWDKNAGIESNGIRNRNEHDVRVQNIEIYIAEVDRSLQNTMRNKSWPSKSSARFYSFVVEPNLPCDSTTNCSASHGGLSLYCSPEGLCKCIPSQCWIYTLEESWFSAEYVFTCGKCGELGSECNHTIPCDFPGLCSRDGFCHCVQGEHREDICFVKRSSAVMEILEATLMVVIFFAAGALIYTTCNSYRRNRTLCWCRESHRRRRRRREQRSRTHGMPSKSPAYTAQQRIMQNFHHSDESTSDDDLREDDDSNIPPLENENENIESTTPKADPPSYAEDKTKYETSHQNSELISSRREPNAEESREPNAEEIPSSSSDASGMTEYFDIHTA